MWSEANFIGGHAALDFVNTVRDTGKARDETLLTRPDDLATWLAVSGMQRLPDTTDIRREDIAMLTAFREVAYRTLVSLNTGRPQNADDMQALETYLKTAVARAQFNAQRAPTTWQVVPGSEHAVLDSFVLLVDDLLRLPGFVRLRQCERCTWFFLNAGRGRGRRWCSMATCGNRHKVEAHRARQ